MAKGSAWCLSVCGERSLPLRGGRPASVCTQCCSGAKQGPVRSCGWRRWQELIPFNTASFSPHQHPVRVRLSSSPFSGEGIVPGHLLGICTPFRCLGKGQDGGQRLGVGGAERGLSHLSPPPRTFSAQHRVWHRKHPLNTWLVKGWLSYRNRVGFPEPPQPALLFPRLPSVTGFPILFPPPSSIQGFLSISQNAPGSQPLQGLHLLLSLPRSPSWSLWLSLASSGRSNLYTVRLSEHESRLPLALPRVCE